MYSRDGECEGVVSDRDPQLFLHVLIYPADANDLPEHRRPHGFDNLDFRFFDLASEVDGRFIAQVSLPEYDVSRIHTGQSEGGEIVWDGVFSPAR